MAMSFSSSLATGASENLACAVPSGRPRCDARTTDLAPFSRQYLIDGSAPAMRALLVITCTLGRTRASAPAARCVAVGAEPDVGGERAAKGRRRFNGQPRGRA